jgi:hypothetical protein
MGSNSHGNWYVLFLDNQLQDVGTRQEINISERRWRKQQYNVTLYKHYVMKGTAETKTKEHGLHRTNKDTSNVYQPTNQKLGCRRWAGVAWGKILSFSSDDNREGERRNGVQLENQ